MQGPWGPAVLGPSAGLAGVWHCLYVGASPRLCPTSDTCPADDQPPLWRLVQGNGANKQAGDRHARQLLRPASGARAEPAAICRMCPWAVQKANDVTNNSRRRPPPCRRHGGVLGPAGGPAGAALVRLQRRLQGDTSKARRPARPGSSYLPACSTAHLCRDLWMPASAAPSASACQAALAPLQVTGDAALDLNNARALGSALLAFTTSGLGWGPQAGASAAGPA